MQTRTATVTTSVLLITGAILANVAFIGLGSVFHYPDILQESTDEIFRQFSAHQGIISFWFVLLALGAGMLAPIAILLKRQFSERLSRLTMWVGITAAIVQVVGLLRWPLLVPGLVTTKNVEAFEFLHTFLGTIVGETLGYLFTGLWTILVSKSLGRHFTGMWFTYLGYIAAGLILLGVLLPLGLSGADMANFIGYVLWSIWLILFAVVLLRRHSQ